MFLNQFLALFCEIESLKVIRLTTFHCYNNIVFANFAVNDDVAEVVGNRGAVFEIELAGKTLFPILNILIFMNP